MRPVLVAFVFVFVLVGALFGALNSDWVSLDFYFCDGRVPKGTALLAALLLGWLIGGLVVWIACLPRMRKQRPAAKALRDGVVPDKNAADRDASGSNAP